jgi:hypothetical protein
MASKNYIFYKIFKEDLDEVYVGSTSNFYSRKKSHKHLCYNETCKQYNYKIYQTIRANGGWDEFKMIQIGTRDNITKREAEQIEEEYRLELKSTMNTQRAFLSPEQRKEKNKEHYQANKERISEKNKVNKERISEKNKEHYQANKEKFNEKGKEKIICEICNIEITRSSKSNHMRTQRHINNINNI